MTSTVTVPGSCSCASAVVLTLVVLSSVMVPTVKGRPSVVQISKRSHSCCFVDLFCYGGCFGGGGSRYRNLVKKRSRNVNMDRIERTDQLDLMKRYGTSYVGVSGADEHVRDRDLRGSVANRDYANGISDLKDADYALGDYGLSAVKDSRPVSAVKDSDHAFGDYGVSDVKDSAAAVKDYDSAGVKRSMEDSAGVSLKDVGGPEEAGEDVDVEISRKLHTSGSFGVRTRQYFQSIIQSVVRLM